MSKCVKGFEDLFNLGFSDISSIIDLVSIDKELYTLLFLLDLGFDFDGDINIFERAYNIRSI